MTAKRPRSLSPATKARRGLLPDQPVITLTVSGSEVSERELGRLLRNMLNPASKPGPPYAHAVVSPEPAGCDEDDNRKPRAHRAQATSPGVLQHSATEDYPNADPCACPCDCAGYGQRDDDGTPGWCDSCRMNIHQEKS